MKKVLVIGEKSYIGAAVNEYLTASSSYQVDAIEMVGVTPTASLFAGYDVIFCAVGIAHIKETAENRHLYFDVNCDLVVSIAKCAREAGVKQFILLSSMAVYGTKEKYITKNTKPAPVSAYGQSKLQADVEIQKLVNDSFSFACLRPPMVYGANCKGNYVTLRKFSLKFPFFPKYKNQRSMLYIGNLCRFVKDCIDEEKNGLFFPQNAEYVNTSEMVKLVSQAHGRKARQTRIFNWLIHICQFGVVKKVFGDLVYEQVDLVDEFSFQESISLTEKGWRV